MTVRGTEFTLADAIEHRNDGTMRTRIFYCDPMQSTQKGSLENNHEEIRYICPKGTDLHKLGLNGQDDVSFGENTSLYNFFGWNTDLIQDKE